MGVMFGFEEVLPIPEGQTLQMKNKPYEVTLKHFKIDYYQDTIAPRLYQSELVVREKGRILAQKKIVVNDPLDIDRVRFYQASWGMTYDFRSAKLRLGGGVLELKPKEVTPIPGTPLSVRANMFLPSFDLDRNGQPTTLNFEGHNPAVQFDFLEKNKIQAQVWLLKNDPTQAYRIVDDRVMPAAPPPFSLVDVDPVLFSGIQVGYDPGAPLFWGSAIVLLIGLGMHFYLHQRRLRILVIAKGTQSQIHLGGWNSRSREDFEQEFSEWAADLRRAVIS
jgi:cytochrome c biogenesis protein ResB